MIEYCSIVKEEDNSLNTEQINSSKSDSIIDDDSPNNRDERSFVENSLNENQNASNQEDFINTQDLASIQIEKENLDTMAGNLIRGECSIESIDPKYYSNIIEILCVSKNEALFASNFDFARQIQDLIDKISAINLSEANLLNFPQNKSIKFSGNETDRAIKCFAQSRFDHNNFNDDPDQIYYGLEASEAFWETEMQRFQERRENAYQKLVNRQNHEIDKLIHRNVSVKLQEPSAARVLRASSQSLKTRRPFEFGFKSARLQSNLTTARSQATSRFQTIVRSQAPANPDVTERSLSLKLQILQQKPTILTKRLVVSPLKKEIREVDTGIYTTSSTVNQGDFSELFEYNRVLKIANDNVEIRKKKLQDAHSNEITEFNREWDAKLRMMVTQKEQEITNIKRPMKSRQYSKTPKIPINPIKTDQTKKSRTILIASKQ